MSTAPKSLIGYLHAAILKNKGVKQLQSHLPPLNFITVHYTYFIVTCMVFSLMFWGSSHPARSISYTDSLFLVVSAMSETGLNTVNLSQMTTFQQVLLWILIVIGSSIFVSIGTILTRKRAFEARFKHVVALQKEHRRLHRRSVSSLGVRDMPVDERLGESRKPAEPVDHSAFESRHSLPRDPTNCASRTGPMVEMPSDPEGGPEKEGSVETSGVNMRTQAKGSVGENGRARSSDADHITFASSPTSEHRHVLSFVGVGGHANSTSSKSLHMDGIYHRGPKEMREEVDGVGESLDLNPYPTYLTSNTTGRNGQVFGLSRAEREHLGGVEYRALQLLAWIVPIYFVAWQLLGCLGLAAYMAYHRASTARENGINPWWLGVFNGVSAFNNSGMSLLDANMIPFQTSVYILITMGLMILAGNTAYPLFLRLILWSMLKLLTRICPSEEQYADYKATLCFILNYPRRVYTNLFPSAPTWWLLFMVITLNGIDWVAFELLNIGNPSTAAIPPHFRVLDGLFQAVAVRSGGFYIISIPSLRIGLQVLYVIMMYISVYPVVITMRHSNVYEERSLGIYTSSLSRSQDSHLHSLASHVQHTLTSSLLPFPNRTLAQSFIHQQIHGQLAHDLWWLVLAILLITCIEVSNFDRDPITYSVFNIAFEVVSAYGCVGISPGLPNAAYSFSGGWHVCSKLILCAVMLRGRHRGLPVALDRAVRLPGAGEEVGLKEDWAARGKRGACSGSGKSEGMGLAPSSFQV